MKVKITRIGEGPCKSKGRTVTVKIRKGEFKRKVKRRGRKKRQGKEKGKDRIPRAKALHPEANHPKEVVRSLTVSSVQSVAPSFTILSTAQ